VTLGQAQRSEHNSSHSEIGFLTSQAFHKYQQKGWNQTIRGQSSKQQDEAKEHTESRIVREVLGCISCNKIEAGLANGRKMDGLMKPRIRTLLLAQIASGKYLSFLACKQTSHSKTKGKEDKMSWISIMQRQRQRQRQRL
jgi:hypothetical protein